MNLMENTVLALVIVLTVVAHVWMFHWFRFKVHEGAILHYLAEAGAEQRSTRDISEHAGLGEKRVMTICRNSKKIKMAGQENDWTLV